MPFQFANSTAICIGGKLTWRGYKKYSFKFDSDLHYEKKDTSVMTVRTSL